MKEHFDSGSLFVIAMTFVLFAAALFTKGFTHELFLESGVFLVSVKLILMAYRNSIAGKVMMKDLAEIKALLQKAE